MGRANHERVRAVFGALHVNGRTPREAPRARTSAVHSRDFRV
jgi:hypothetical protein